VAACGRPPGRGRPGHRAVAGRAAGEMADRDLARAAAGRAAARRPGCARAAKQQPVINALEVYRSLPRYVAARAVGGRLPGVLACAARGLDLCAACAEGDRNRCDRVTVGHVSPGLQTGFCTDTGGGWSGQLVAHVSQLHAVPDELPDERAVLVEPLACAVHAA